ncbi:uncharacterized protein LOC134266678 [Saccostrea cucullata]|uniref:uncharacterized protein LOC134266678 n=1 Tax=Saccostrea cuccullata TaxID=36930 RepID=UPI002ED346D1
MAELPMKQEAGESDEDKSLGCEENQRKKQRTSKKSLATKESALFEASVLQHISDDEEGNFFAKLSPFKEGRYLLKTKFHEDFVDCMRDLRLIQNDWNLLSGIEGLGISSSAMYYVLECRKENDISVHYVDLNKIEERDKNLVSFGAYCKNFLDRACLIIDHVTLYNSHYLENIKKMVHQQVKDAKFILIETGFTADASHLHCNIFGRNHQLDEDSSLKIWKGSVEYLFSQRGKTEKDYSRCVDLKEKGKEVYERFSKEYIMTPKLLNDVLEDIFVGRDRKVEEAFERYTQKRRNSIKDFRECLGNKELDKFILHTRFLLRFTPGDGQHILRPDASRPVAINLFELEHCQVTEEDEYWPTMAKEGFDEGDSCVKVRHLFPLLAKDWNERLPCDLEKLFKLDRRPVMSPEERVLFERKRAENILKI